MLLNAPRRYASNDTLFGLLQLSLSTNNTITRILRDFLLPRDLHPQSNSRSLPTPDVLLTRSDAGTRAALYGSTTSKVMNDLTDIVVIMADVAPQQWHHVPASRASARCRGVQNSQFPFGAGEFLTEKIVACRCVK